MPRCRRGVARGLIRKIGNSLAISMSIRGMILIDVDVKHVGTDAASQSYVDSWQSLAPRSRCHRYCKSACAGFYVMMKRPAERRGKHGSGRPSEMKALG